MMNFERIFIQEEVRDHEDINLILDSFPEATANYYRKDRELPRGGEWAEGINRGKKTLVLAHRRANFISRFVNKDKGVYCPQFYKLAVGYQCPYDCSYCFLLATFRTARNFVCLYLNEEEMHQEIHKLDQENNKPVLLNAGELSDPLALNSVYGVIGRLVEFIADLRRVRLLLLTKSGRKEIENLLNVDHRQKTVLAWSLNGQVLIDELEVGTRCLKDRTEALALSVKAGYRTRIRIDPLLIHPGWKKNYTEMVEYVFGKRGLRPERITLGSFRAMDTLWQIIKRRYPQTMLTRQSLIKEGKRYKYSFEERYKLYNFVIGEIRKYYPEASIALCKESADMNRALKQEVGIGRCNCVA